MPLKESENFLKKHGDFGFGKTQIYTKMQDKKDYNATTN